jgi:ketosteroid isomerase-like protein
MRPEDVALRFNQCINGADILGLGELMTDDHVFTDTAGASIRGKAPCLEAWHGFFEQFPDYRNTFTDVTASENRVVAIGFSTCSTPILDGPAIWTAAIEDDKVAAWRVYEDTSSVRAELKMEVRPG